MSNGLPKSVVFITGTFISSNCWDEWQSYFESKGYMCLVPVWPHKDASPEELRNRPSKDALASNRLTGLTDYFAGIIEVMPEPPILIGHSLGGLIVQLLLQRGLGIAGVALHPFPPRGVSQFSLFRILLDHIRFFTSPRKTYLVSFQKWKQAFANEMSCEDQKSLYYKYAIPESKRILFDTLTSAASVNFNKPHPPLLLTAGGKDVLIPTTLVYRNYLKYNADNSLTDFKVFENSNHLIFDHPTMHAEADDVLHWLDGKEINT